MFNQFRNVTIVLGLVALMAGCGQETHVSKTPMSEGDSSQSRMAAGARDEWKYECRGTILSGYQWVYVGTAPHSQAERGTYFCYGYSSLSNFCTEVRYGGVLGLVTACNFVHLGQVAYTWNRW